MPSTKRPVKQARRSGASAKRFGPVEMFYARAIAIEREAAARYRELAHQVAGFGNTPTAELFQRLARLESEHAERLLEASAGMTLPPAEKIDRDPAAAEGTEIPNFEFAYRRVPPQHALLMALAGERRAKAYFDRARKSSKDAAVRRLAAVFAREEADHIASIEDVLASETTAVQHFDDLEV